MTLRRIGSSHQPVEVMLDPGEDQQEGWGYAASMRWRLAFMRAVLVAITVGVISVASYWTVSSSLTSSVDERLERKASTLLERAQDPEFYASVEEEIAMLKSYNQDLRVALSPPGWEYVVGDSIALPADLPRPGRPPAPGS